MYFLLFIYFSISSVSIPIPADMVTCNCYVFDADKVCSLKEEFDPVFKMNYIVLNVFKAKPLKKVKMQKAEWEVATAEAVKVKCFIL